MRVLALGGCGQEGSTAVRRLSHVDDVKEIVIADLNSDKAATLAEEIGPKGRSIGVDVRDAEQLNAALRNANVAANFVGPYFKYQKLVLEAAIAAGVHYLDISDDWDPTVECLELHGLAEEAGVSAILGLGVSPGSLNLLAKYASDKLARTDEVHIRWAVSITDVEDVEGSAAVHHALHMVEKPFPTFKDGGFVDVEAFSDPETFRFTLLGEQPVFNVGHPEPITLPRYIAGLKTVTQKGSCPGFNEAWQAIHALGLTTTEPVEVNGGRVDPQEVAMALMERIEPGDPSELPPPNTELHVIIRGSDGSGEVEYEYRFESPVTMSPLTGIPAYLGVLWLGRGKVASPGVFAPEGCIEPAPFIEALRAEGFEIEESVRTKHIL